MSRPFPLIKRRSTRKLELTWRVSDCEELVLRIKFLIIYILNQIIMLPLPSSLVFALKSNPSKSILFYMQSKKRNSNGVKSVCAIYKRLSDFFFKSAKLPLYILVQYFHHQQQLVGRLHNLPPH